MNDCSFQEQDNSNRKTFDELHHMLQQVVQGFSAHHSAVYFDALFVDCSDDVDSSSIINSISVARALFDTGALCANYISKQFFKEMESRIPVKCVTYERTRVGLADGGTTITSDTRVELTMDFVSSSGVKQRYTGQYVVIDMKGNDIIIGLPAIVRDMWLFFKGNIENVVAQQEEKLNALQHLDQPCISEEHAIDDDDESEGDWDEPMNFFTSYRVVNALLEPWSNVFEEEAPEELEVPLPTQFGDASAFLGKTRAEAIEEYESLFDSHVAPEFREACPIYDLLKDKGQQVFIPTDWTGISGVEPLKLEFKEELPARLKPGARPVNPRLWEAAEKEFLRLKSRHEGETW